MIDRFLKAKHWQLFLLVFGIPLVFQIVLMISVVANVTQGRVPDMFSFLLFIPVVMILSTGVHYGWLYSVALGLKKKMPAAVTMNVKRFKLLLILLLVYLVLFSATVVVFGFYIKSAVMDGMFNSNEPPAFIPVFISIYLIALPFHAFAFFCTIYCLYFVAKTFKTVELQRETKFSDYVGEFFLIWFFPIGVWIIQPKINRIAESPASESLQTSVITSKTS